MSLPNFFPEISSIFLIENIYNKIDTITIKKESTLEKAYDPKALVEKLKGRGLDLAEEAGKIVVEEVFAWVEESAKLSPTPYDDIALIVMPQLKAKALAAVDKLDGVEG